MRIIKTANYDDVARRYLEDKCSVGSVRKILEEEGVLAAEQYLESKGVGYGDARGCISALKAD